MQKDLIGDQKSFSFIVAMGLIIGVVIGALAGNLGLWISAGIVVGAIAGIARAKMS